MNPAMFSEANRTFGAPPGWDESQCGTLAAFVGQIVKGNIDGSMVIVTAWQPSPEEIADLVLGHPVFISFITKVLPPHFLTTRFPYKPTEVIPL